MERIYHPVSGESGYFTTEQEKIVIDAVISDLTAKNQLVVQSSRSARGGEFE